MSALKDGDWSGITVASPYGIPISAEELYQTFKERLMNELAAKRYVCEELYETVELLDLVDKEQK